MLASFERALNFKACKRSDSPNSARHTPTYSEQICLCDQGILTLRFKTRIVCYFLEVKTTRRRRGSWGVRVGGRNGGRPSISVSGWGGVGWGLQMKAIVGLFVGMDVQLTRHGAIRRYKRHFKIYFLFIFFPFGRVGGGGGGRRWKGGGGGGKLNISKY